jgi:hypothetical protein
MKFDRYVEGWMMVSCMRNLGIIFFFSIGESDVFFKRCGYEREVGERGGVDRRVSSTAFKKMLSV